MTMRDLGALNPTEAGRWFGKHYCLDPMHTTITNQYEICIEIAINGTSCLPAVLGGQPAIRGLGANGGPNTAYLNTQCATGVDAGNEAGGNFGNDFGVFLIEYDGKMYTQVIGKLLRIWLPALATAPTVGDTITQAVSLATGTVMAVNTVENWIDVLDLGTGVNAGAGIGAWDTINTISDALGGMLPANPIPRTMDWRTTNVANQNYDATINPLVPIGLDGLFETLVQGDLAGTGYNGAIADGTDITYNDDIAAYCAGGYHTAVGTGPDNIYGYAQEAAAANTNHVPEIITVHHRHTFPNIHSPAGKQGTTP